jgi:hypothetical protein
VENNQPYLVEGLLKFLMGDTLVPIGVERGALNRGSL